MITVLTRRCRRLLVNVSFQFWDVAIVGGGHAGCEAASASARTGAKTILITQKTNTIGQMSCNPSMGGVGKGHLVRQIDALGGLIGKVSDLSALQFKVLNEQKGEAVKGPRAQIDREMYKSNMQRALKDIPNLTIKEASVEDLQIDQETNCVKGVLTSQGMIECRKVVLTTGTFLRGMIHIGKTKYPAGRHIRNSQSVQPPSIALAKTLERLKFPLGRLTTGTPPRLDKTTIDYSQLGVQGSDNPIQPFNFIHEWEGYKPNRVLLDCHLTSTNQSTHDVVQKYRDQLPEFQGNGGKGQGPRYCPAIQKKVIRFPQKKSHQVWLQPQGYNSNVVYPNGLNNGFPADIQLKLLRTVKGLQKVEIVRPGYAIEYDYVDPKQLRSTLQSSLVGGLYMAGQINGTTGYEQAAAQGIVAGINAGLSCRGSQEYIVQRSKAFIGVLINDLVTLGVSEPYRMFTSRSEYRLILRSDNADERLTEDAIRMGIASQKQKAVLQEKKSKKQQALLQLSLCKKSMKFWAENLKNCEVKEIPVVKSASQVVADYQKVKIYNIEAAIRGMKHIDSRLHRNIESDLKYQRYSTRMYKDIQRMKKDQMFGDISGLNYDQYRSQFTAEEFQKLTTNRPKTIHAASRLSGIRPTTLLYLHFLKKQSTQKSQPLIV